MYLLPSEYSGFSIKRAEKRTKLKIAPKYKDQKTVFLHASGLGLPYSIKVFQQRKKKLD